MDGKRCRGIRHLRIAVGPGRERFQVAVNQHAALIGINANAGLAKARPRLSALLRRLLWVHDLGVFEGRAFLAMAYVRGESLAERLRRGPLEPRQAAELVALLCDAVAHAHAAGVLHRDLKPANVLFDAEGRALLTDFGLAKDSGSTLNLTREGQRIGTPLYMAPELLRAGAPYGPPADVYAFGVLMWEVLTRELPFGGMGAGAIRAAVLGGERPAVPLSCPTALGELMQACWSEDPGQRPDAATLLQQLKDAQAALPIARALDA